MKPESDLERLRDDIEARQKNILWEDSQENARRVSASLWNESSRSRPSSITWAVLFLLLAIAIVCLPFLKGFEDGTVVALLVASGPLFLSYKLFRESFRSRKARSRNI